MPYLILVFLVVFTIVFLYLPYRRDIAAAYQRLEAIERQTIQTACGPIEAAIRGQGEPVLISHGIAGGFDQGLGLAEAHLSEGMQAIAVSRFGYLDTPLPENASPASQADAYLCLLDALNLDKVTVLANSAGGASAIQMALRHPDRVKALVLVSSVAPAAVVETIALPPKPVIQVVFGSDFLMWLITTKFQSMMHATVGVPEGYSFNEADHALVSDLIRSILPIQPRQAGFVFDMFNSNLDMDRHSQAYPVEELHVPTLIISALDDPLVKYENARTMAERIPNAQFYTFPSGGHLLLGSGDTVRVEIAKFLEALASPQSNE
ncbi:MAG: alpha/beta hydrolase [Anaerolineales bacterium]|jgi:pimeloyl-ACP methyl ester carboxylesterase|nr:alpha/beta hydrolase [Anaerolineales bacterium]